MERVERVEVWRYGRVERSETERGETEMKGVSQSAAVPLTVKGFPSCLASFPGTWE